MRRTIVLIASTAINASTIPAVASECTLNKDIDASRTRWATLRFQRPVGGEVRQLILTTHWQSQSARCADDPLTSHEHLDVVPDLHRVTASILGQPRRGHL